MTRQVRPYPIRTVEQSQAATTVRSHLNLQQKSTGLAGLPQQLLHPEGIRVPGVGETQSLDPLFEIGADALGPIEHSPFEKECCE
ncbi:hypothetical protein COCCU_09745 [Corynebacterium occultum]|uniref:Uncharacterized protein n=1 Tax=Corynebacterium occultum TaxID=2675219 RepID=A0A6B8VUM4_9CORY|nr:hypothetical protein [Corynebacterium occultum]QGU07873.1 hypothetical protein COCCU_09745 [Corynebacterium occultum]